MLLNLSFINSCWLSSVVQQDFSIAGRLAEGSQDSPQGSSESAVAGSEVPRNGASEPAQRLQGNAPNSASSQSDLRERRKSMADPIASPDALKVRDIAILASGSLGAVHALIPLLTQLLDSSLQAFSSYFHRHAGQKPAQYMIRANVNHSKLHRLPGSIARQRFLNARADMYS